MAKTKCPKCGAILTCTCKLRTDASGVQGCTNCVGTQQTTINTTKK